MPGLVPGIHEFTVLGVEDVDGRVKPSDDEEIRTLFEQVRETS